MKKILIIGCGPAGMTAAYQIQKNKQFQCTIVEQSDYIGGMARSFNLFDQIVDVGPHRFFSNDKRVNEIWLEVIGSEYKMVNRITRIYYKNKFFDYPLKPLDAFLKLGIIESLYCIISYISSLISPSKFSETFEGWVTNKFGKRLYQIFFKSYTEKLWGIPCEELTSEFAQQRIKKFSLGEAFLSAFKLNSKNHKTLVDQFAYPLKGNGYVYEKMHNLFLFNGGETKFNTVVDKIIINPNETFSVYLNNNIETFDHIISTMPITNLLTIVDKIPQNLIELSNNLIFRNTLIAYVKLDNMDLFVDQWIYVQDENILSGRITNFNNWIKDIRLNQSGTVLALEYWCYSDDDIWLKDEEYLREQVISDLKNCGFIKKNEDILDFYSLKVPKCYPVYKEGYKSALNEIVEYFKEISNLQLIGRYGSFKYNNQDHSILMGHLAALNILENQNNDTWQVNTDYEYQESTVITSTGLVEN